MQKAHIRERLKLFLTKVYFTVQCMMPRKIQRLREFAHADIGNAVNNKEIEAMFVEPGIKRIVLPIHLQSQVLSPF